MSGERSTAKTGKRLTTHRTPRAVNPIGLLGGTFDPIHFGHLRMAEELAEALDIGQVRFIPAGNPPHRGQPRADARHRLEMTRLAVAGNPRFTLDDREIARDRPSYSAETLADLRAGLSADSPLVLFMGSDAFLGLNTWHEWRKLFDLAHIAVAHRPGFSPTLWEDALPDELRRQLAKRLTDQPGDLAEAPAGRVFLHAITQLDISASQVRDRCLRGKSLRYLLPDSIIDYIHGNRQYA
jgi:nicotinate-nucleotide adenylyltransferase